MTEETEEEEVMTTKQFWQQVFLDVIRGGKDAATAKDTADLAIKSQPKGDETES